MYSEMEHNDFPNAFFKILHAPLTFMLLYCKYKSNDAKLITVQIPQYTESEIITYSSLNTQ